METIEHIGKVIIQEREKFSSNVIEMTEEERTNQLLDGLLDLKQKINSTNERYLRLFPLFDELATLEIQSDEDSAMMDEILLGFYEAQ